MTDIFSMMALPAAMPPRARSTDPITSHMAAAESHKFSGTHAEKILAAIRHQPGQTPEFYSSMTGLTVVQIDRRLKEMEGAGLIQPTGNIYKKFRCWEPV